MDYLDRLARCAAELRLDALPASTVTAAKLVLLDTLGAIVAGSRLPENTRLARLAATRVPHGMAALLGHGARSDAFWAALTNATAGVALEVDEGNRDRKSTRLNSSHSQISYAVFCLKKKKKSKPRYK